MSPTLVFLSSIQFSSVAQSCPALCNPMDCGMPGSPVHHQLPKLTQTHVHQVGDAIQPSHPLLSPSPPTFNLSQHHSSQYSLEWTQLHLANPLKFFYIPGRLEALVKFKYVPIYLVFKDPYLSTPFVTDPADTVTSATLLCCHDYVKHPVIYLHMKPSPRERNMSASQKEWPATIRALDKLRSCVFSQKFTLWTNHQTLTWLTAECNRNGNTRTDGLGSFCFSKWTFNMFLVGKECLREKKKRQGGG